MIKLCTLTLLVIEVLIGYIDTSNTGMVGKRWLLGWQPTEKILYTNPKSKLLSNFTTLYPVIRNSTENTNPSDYFNFSLDVQPCQIFGHKPTQISAYPCKDCNKIEDSFLEEDTDTEEPALYFKNCSSPLTYQIFFCPVRSNMTVNIGQRKGSETQHLEGSREDPGYMYMRRMMVPDFQIQDRPLRKLEKRFAPLNKSIGLGKKSHTRLTEKADRLGREVDLILGSSGSRPTCAVSTEANNGINVKPSLSPPPKNEDHDDDDDLAGKVKFPSGSRGKRSEEGKWPVLVSKTLDYRTSRNKAIISSEDVVASTQVRT